MSWKVWKQPSERAAEEFQNGYRKGLNLSNWNSAVSCFSSAYELYNNLGDGANAALARALALFSKALANPQIAENWANAAIGLSNIGLTEINVTQAVPTKDLVQESNLKASELKARNTVNNLEKASQLEEIAKQFLAFGGKGLIIPLLLEKQQTTGQAKAHRMIAEASQLRGNEEIDINPKHASEFYRMAAIHMKTAGDLESSQYLSRKAEDFSASALCYFCGREVTGKDINFVYMKAELTRFIEKQNAARILPSTSANMVVACKGCHSAITIAADEIARAYFDRVEAELRKLEAEISQLKGRMGRVESRG
jgi:hypothetical protein